MPEYQSRRDTKYTNSKHLLGNDIKTHGQLIRSSGQLDNKPLPVKDQHQMGPQRAIPGKYRYPVDKAAAMDRQSNGGVLLQYGVLMSSTRETRCPVKPELFKLEKLHDRWLMRKG
ncbi:uncharacterized protein TERG_08656 [Trichophyton rubrum CBS 118892]|uniref:Uncharacterized protein n=1 Tax=Trichophyton rubrum (strain ATCC MYA-4607 / CBS 118892) TaxID=559305 RepID=F2SFU1_TRIRC|nr:uncharacterized protein TERG_08656 [Trichophyton rubrum CBS 118892]EGD84174.2 hypothetical protein TERG_08656 [Trichophyton rubrum CBS 118892]